MPDDAGAARAFVSGQLANERYRARALEVLDSALAFEDPEFMALLALDADGRTLTGIVLFGTVAGAHGVAKVHGVVSARLDVATALLAAVTRTSERSGERMIVCEIPDDPALAVAAEALAANGYAEAGRVPDFVRPGMALRLLVRPLLDA